MTDGWLDCQDLSDEGITSVRCCASCHTDEWEYGYDLHEHILLDGRTCYVCCTVAADLREQGLLLC